MQFSLRSLLIATFLLAVLLAGWFGYRRATLARLTWLPLSSPKAEALFPVETVQATTEGQFRFTYHSRRKRLGSHPVPTGFSGRLSFRDNGQTLSAETDSEAAAHNLLQSVRDADVLPTGRQVIRGRVVDRKGRPLAGAIVDLMGPFVFINHFQTRDDGTFTLTLEDGGGLRPPPGSGYYLRIRAPEETAERHVRWNTPRFALDPAEPERVALITVPR